MGAQLELCFRFGHSIFLNKVQCSGNTLTSHLGRWFLAKVPSSCPAVTVRSNTCPRGPGGLAELDTWTQGPEVGRGSGGHVRVGGSQRTQNLAHFPCPLPSSRVLRVDPEAQTGSTLESHEVTLAYVFMILGWTVICSKALETPRLHLYPLGSNLILDTSGSTMSGAHGLGPTTITVVLQVKDLGLREVKSVSQAAQQSSRAGMQSRCPAALTPSLQGSLLSPSSFSSSPLHPLPTLTP